MHTRAHTLTLSLTQTHTNTPREGEVNITLLSRMQKKFMLPLERERGILCELRWAIILFSTQTKKGPFFWERASHQYFSQQPQDYSNICTKWANVDLSLGRNVLFLPRLFLPPLISMAPSNNILFGHIKVQPEKSLEVLVFKCYCTLHASHIGLHGW